MKTPREVGLEMWISTRTAQPREVKEFAETVSSDPEFVNAVIAEYFKLQSNAAGLRAAADRNMPD